MLVFSLCFSFLMIFLKWTFIIFVWYKNKRRKKRNTMSPWPWELAKWLLRFAQHCLECEVQLKQWRLFSHNSSSNTLLIELHWSLSKDYPFLQNLVNFLGYGLSSAKLPLTDKTSNFIFFSSEFKVLSHYLEVFEIVSSCLFAKL